MQNNWLHRTLKTLHKNVSPSDMQKRYGDRTDWIYDPDMIAVAGYHSKYWTINPDDTVSLKSDGDRDAIDAIDAQAAIDADRVEQKQTLKNNRRWRATIRWLATKHGMTPQAVRGEIEAIMDNI